MAIRQSMTVNVWVDKKMIVFNAEQYEIGEYGDLNVYDEVKLVASFSRGSWHGVWLGISVMGDELTPTREILEWKESGMASMAKAMGMTIEPEAALAGREFSDE